MSSVSMGLAKQTWNAVHSDTGQNQRTELVSVF